MLNHKVFLFVFGIIIAINLTNADFGINNKVLPKIESKILLTGDNNYYNNTYQNITIINGSSYNATYDKWAYNQTTPPQNLSGYALLNGSNQPFTGDININKVNPTLLLTNSQTGKYTSFERSYISNEFTLTNVNEVSSDPIGLGFNISSARARFNYNNSNQVGKGDFSFTGWYKLDDLTSTHLIFSQRKIGGAKTGFSIGITNDEKPLIIIDYGVTQVFYTSTQIARDYNWHFIAFKVNRTGDIYVRLDASSWESLGNIASWNATNLSVEYPEISIGAFESSYAIQGSIDELVLYNKLISDAEADRDYALASGYNHDGSESGIITLIKMDENTGTETVETKTGMLNYDWTSSPYWVTGRVATSSVPYNISVINVIDSPTPSPRAYINLGDYFSTLALRGDEVRAISPMRFLEQTTFENYNLFQREIDNTTLGSSLGVNEIIVNANVNESTSQKITGTDSTINLLGPNNYTGLVAGNNFIVNHAGTGIVGDFASQIPMIGILGILTKSGNGILDYGVGIASSIQNTGIGKINHIVGIASSLYDFNNATIGDAKLLALPTPYISGSVDNLTGLYIEDMSNIGTTESYNILSKGSDSVNIFEGKVNIGNLTTGSNAGSNICIDANNQLCACGSCA